MLVVAAVLAGVGVVVMLVLCGGDVALVVVLVVVVVAVMVLSNVAVGACARGRKRIPGTSSRCRHLCIDSGTVIARELLETPQLLQ